MKFLLIILLSFVTFSAYSQGLREGGNNDDQSSIIKNENSISEQFLNSELSNPLISSVLTHYRKTARYPLEKFPITPQQHDHFFRELKSFLLRAAGVQSDQTIQDLYDIYEVGNFPTEKLNYRLILIKLTKTGDVVPAAICLPRGADKVPSVAVFGGHTKSGLLDLTMRPKSYQKAIASVLCLSGYGTIALAKIDSGIMSLRFSETGIGKSDENLAALLLYGTNFPIASRQLMASLAAIDILTKQKRIDRARVATAGVSLGGWIALQTGIADDRVSAVLDFGRKTLFVEPYLDNPASFRRIKDHSHIFPGLFHLGDRHIYPFAAVKKDLLIGYGRSDTQSAESMQSFILDSLSLQAKTLQNENEYEVYAHSGGDELDVKCALGFLKKVFTID